MARLTVRNPDGTTHDEPITSDIFTFGRSRRNELVLDAPGISRRHGRLVRTEDGWWWVEDLSSTNGILVCGELRTKHKLKEEDVITVGGFELTFSMTNPPKPTSAYRPADLTIVDTMPRGEATVERPASGMSVTDNARLIALYEMTKRLMGRRDVIGLIDEAANALIRSLGVEMLVFGLSPDPEPGPDQIVVRPHHMEGAEVKISRSVLSRALEAQRAVLIRDTSSDHDLMLQHSIVSGHIHSALCVPLVSDAGSIGFIYMDNREMVQSYTEEDLDFASAIGAMVGAAIENARLYEAQLIKERLETELAGARRVQEAILPSSWPELEGWDIYGEHTPCNEVGGDFHDALLSADGRIWMTVADVSGKGAPAALFASRVHAAMQALIDRCDSPGDLLTRLNELIVRRDLGSMFVTCIIMVLDPVSGEVRLSAAGHSPPVYVSAAQPARELAMDTGLILGIESGMTYEDTIWQFPKGDAALILYTDGLSETFSPDRELFMEKGMFDAMSACASCSAREAVRRLQERAEAFRGDQPRTDDLTLLVCRRLLPESADTKAT